MILIENTELEVSLKYLLQREVTVKCKDKHWKRGKVLLFNQVGFCIEMIIQGKKKQERIEMPIPFKVELWEEEGLVYFDYTFNTLTFKNKGLADAIRKLPSDKKSRFYDSIIEIEVQNDI